MTDAARSLDELRREIDETDDALHDLMMRRMELAAEVAAAKAGAPGPVWRPAREAQIFRRLFDRHDGSFSPMLLYVVWRQLISESISRQRPLGVAVLEATFPLAAGHFPNCDVYPVNRPEEALAHAAEDADTIAVLPGPEDGLWAVLPKIVAQRRKTPGLNLLALLPFLDDLDPDPDMIVGATVALVFGRAPPEASGEDVTLIVSFWSPDGELPRNPRKHPKPPPGEMARGERAGANPFAICDGATVFEMDGLVGPDDPRLANFQAPMILGTYAIPIRLDLSGGAGLTDSDDPDRE